MKQFAIRSTLILFLLAAGLFTWAQEQEPENKAPAEPKTTFEISINGKKYQLAENEELKIDSVLSSLVISIKLADNKKFESSRMSFDYPKNLSYGFEENPGLKSWTLSGNNATVIVLEMDVDATLDMMMNEMVKKFGKKNCTLEKYRKELGQKMWDCQKLSVKIAGEKITMECFSIKLDDFKSRFIYFQNSAENDIRSSEYDDVFNIINSTIRFN